MAHVLARIPPDVHPIVVDNGSTDATASVARALGAEVVVEPQRGFGAACFAGLQAASSDIVCFMDCDGSLDGAELPRVTAPIVAGGADLVLGARRITTKKSWPLHARIANRALARIVTHRHGHRLTDLGPMRAARRSALLDLGIVDRRFGWPLEMVLRAARANWRIVEVPVSYQPRIGKSKVTGTARGTVLTMRDVLVALR